MIAAPEPSYPPYKKFSTDELMALVDLFNVSAEGQSAIRHILDHEKEEPNAWLFRYYGEKSRVAELEERFAKKMGSKYALAVNSGTSALIAALVAAGVGPGDEVIVPGYTFFASVSAIVVAKAIPRVVDIDESLCLDPVAVEASITGRTKAIMVVHMVGHPAKMDVLREIADRHNLCLIEDVAQAVGGSYQGRALGSWGHIGCFSLDAYKAIASGEGGMLITDDEWLHTRATSYHDTAACWRPDRYAEERKPGELFCGENYRLSELAGAVGIVQLKKLDWIVRRSRKTYRKIRGMIDLPAGVSFIEPADPKGVCGTMLGIHMGSVEDAAKVANGKFGLMGLAGGGGDGARNWHLCTFWEHLHDLKTATRVGCPFKCPHVNDLPEYSRDMCPRTREIVLRTVFFRIEPTMTEDYVQASAEKINRGLRGVVG
jgi:dTDP-4-amino-4,6-dideoxygalactose transaminase